MFFKFFCWLFYDKMLNLLWKTIVIFIGTQYFKFHMLCTAPLYSTLKWQWYLSLLSSIYFQIFLYKYNKFLYYHMTHAALLLITSFFFFLELIIFTACSFNKSQNLFIQSLCLYTYMLIFYACKWRYCPLKNLMEYVCLL